MIQIKNMKKIFITAGLLVSMLFRTTAQSSVEENADYEKRKLKIDEINFVTSYYHQEGDKSAVTGGIGTEKLVQCPAGLSRSGEIEGRGPNDSYRDPLNYYITIFGTPSKEKPWGWRMEGHHLAITFSYGCDRAYVYVVLALRGGSLMPNV